MKKALLLSFFLVGCSTVDPGEAITHVHVGKYVIDLTIVGPIVTIICLPLLYWAIKRFLGKAMDAKETLQQERHDAVICELKKITDRFAKVDKRFHGHGHVIEVNGQKYITNDITVRMGGEGL